MDQILTHTISPSEGISVGGRFQGLAMIQSYMMSRSPDPYDHQYQAKDHQRKDHQFLPKIPRLEHCALD